MEKRKEIVHELQKSYWKEIETVMNYLANSVNLDGIHAEEIREILEAEVSDELGHAKKLADRIKELDGTVEGSKRFSASQDTMQPPDRSTDVRTVIEGVIDAEKDAIDQYKHIIGLTDGVDFVTQDLAIQLMADEEKHLRIFRGFIKDYEQA